jgi:Apea-like HEPN
MECAVTFGFEIRFHTPAGRTIDSVGIDTEVPLHFSGISERISLSQLPRKSNDVPSSPERFRIKGTGFSTEDGARTFGERLKLAIAIVGCETGVGIDVGRDLESPSFGSSVIEAAREKYGHQLRGALHGLDVFSEDLPVSRMEVSGIGSATFSLKGFPKKIADELAAIKALSSKQSLALELYNLAQFEPAPRVRFLNLITIVEVLTIRESMATHILEHIDKLKQAVKESELTADEKSSLSSRLRELKKESIGAACRRTVAKHCGATESKYFSDCYTARSELVHDGQTSGTQMYDWSQLDEIVRRVLLAMIRAVDEPANAAPRGW